MSGETAVDTNVLVRVLAADEPSQAARAIAILEGGPAWIPKTVLLETVWALRSAYGIDEARLQEVLTGILALKSVLIEGRSEVEQALEWWKGGLDFADALHLASSSGAARLVTFDRGLARRARRLRTAPPVEPL